MKQKQKRIEYLHGTHVVRVPLVALIGLILAVAALTLFLWTYWRPVTVRLSVQNPGDVNALMPSIVGITQGSLEPGNQVQLLQNGDGFFPPLFRDIAAARQTVHIESYIWWEGRVCDELAALLARKAREGVEVRLLVDASGGHKMKKELAEEMARAGVKLVNFHPITLSTLGRLNNRDHRKMAIIDGRIGYIGGYGFAKEWTGHAQDKEHWRDTGLRVVGPVVNRLQGAFCENWVEQTGEVPAGEKYFPKPEAAGSTPAHVAYTSPTGSVSSVQVLFYLAIKSAKRELIIQNPYLLPSDDAMEALEEAVRRGVDVKIMVPGTKSTDSPIVQHASHHHFGTLLKRGVKIYEYNKTLLHQKILIVDGLWSGIGSTNFDDRSFELNDEVTMGVVDPQIAAQLRAAFDADMRYAEERHLQEWANRSVWHKALDGLAYVARGQL
ncbi:MAG TPA: cardiolipin synthase [Thermoanaerobaculia bacterium]|nr:cardiolipin synthase [Thermoanaerobaculia bacterium]